MGVDAPRRVLVIGADGLRPDLLDPAVMPTVARLAEGGVRFTDHHAVYPTHTRVNISALATGTTPGRHGIVANTMLAPDATEDHIIDTSNYQHLDALDRFSNGAALLTPSLGEILAACGERVAVAATSSGGASMLWTRNDRGRIVNVNTTYGIADLYDLREKLGEVPALAWPQAERARYATRAVTDIFLDDVRNRVIVLWLNEPDASLHRFGLGSPETIEAMRVVDDCVSSILGALDQRGIRDAFDVFFISDHGHSTVQSHQTLRDYLGIANGELGGTLPPLMTASDYIYAAPGSAPPAIEQLAPLVEWLMAQEWCDVVCAGREDLEGLPGVLPLRCLWNGNLTARTPLLAVSPRWSYELNACGVPGAVAALTTQSALKSSHGSLSPFDLHATLIANGPSFREGVTSDVPTGAVDLLPTILSILGIDAPSTLDGRVLWEGLAGSHGEPGRRQEQVIEPEVGAAGRSPRIRVLQVGSTTYVDGSMREVFVPSLAS